MSKFFHGWRRKAGLVMLLTASVFSFWWLRSQSVCDVIFVQEKNKFLNTYLFDIVTLFDSDYVNVIASDRSSIHWLRRMERNPQTPFYMTHPAGGDVLEQMTPQANVSNPVVVVQVPYPAIVVPMILLATWLLSGKLRSKQPGVEAPVPG